MPLLHPQIVSIPAAAADAAVPAVPVPPPPATTVAVAPRLTSRARPSKSSSLIRKKQRSLRSGTSPTHRFPPPLLGLGRFDIGIARPETRGISNDERTDEHEQQPPLEQALILHWRRHRVQTVLDQVKELKRRHLLLLAQDSTTSSSADSLRWNQIYHFQHSKCRSSTLVRYYPSDIRSAESASYVHSYMPASSGSKVPIMPSSLVKIPSRQIFGVVSSSSLPPPLVLSQAPFPHQCQDVWILLCSLLPFAASHGILINCCGASDNDDDDECARYWPSVGKFMLMCGGDLRVETQSERIVYSGSDGVPALIRRELYVSRINSHTTVPHCMYVSQLHFIGWRRNHVAQIEPECLAAAVRSVQHMWACDSFVTSPVIHCTRGVQRSAVVAAALTLSTCFRDHDSVDANLLDMTQVFRDARQAFLPDYAGLLLAAEAAVLSAATTQQGKESRR